MPPDVVVDPQIVAAAHAAVNQPGGDPMKWPFGRSTAASANLDDIRRKFYSEAKADESTKNWWIRQVLVDPNELVVQDELSGQLFRISYASASTGEITFGDPEPVRLELVKDDSPAVLKEAAVAASQLLAVGRQVAASWSSQAESRLETTGGKMDPQEIRKQLGLAADASDEQVQTALLAKAGITAEEPEPAPADSPAPDQQPSPEPAPQVPTPDTPSTTDEPNASPHGAQVLQFPGGQVPPGMVLVDKSALDSALGVAAKAGKFIEDQEKSDRERKVLAAISDGRIPPASKDSWLTLLEKDPNAEQTLASLAPGLVPVSERGHSHSPDQHELLQHDAEQVSNWTADLFPEVRGRRELAQSLASADLGQRPRIMTDANLRR
jgi:hypothetical protein